MQQPPAAGRPTPAQVSQPSLWISAAWGAAGLFVVSMTFFLYAYLVRFGREVSPGPAAGPAAADLALFSAFALHHSLFARSGLKAWVRDLAPPVLERTIYTAVASVLFIGVCWWWMPVPGVFYRLPGPWRWVGVAAQIAGIVFTVLAARAIDVLDLAGVRQVLRAAPSARAKHVPLSTSGVYGLVRHPLYFGWALFVFGAPDMTATRFGFAVASTAYLALAIPWEERGLMEAFGPEYAAYRREVPWRMVPGLY